MKKMDSGLKDSKQDKLKKKGVDNWIIVVVVVLAALLIANLMVSGTIFAAIPSLLSASPEKNIFANYDGPEKAAFAPDAGGPGATSTGRVDSLKCGEGFPWGTKNVNFKYVTRDYTTNEIIWKTFSDSSITTPSQCRHAAYQFIKMKIKSQFKCIGNFATNCHPPPDNLIGDNCVKPPSENPAHQNKCVKALNEASSDTDLTRAPSYFKKASCKILTDDRIVMFPGGGCKVNLFCPSGDVPVHCTRCTPY
jgi:hypothetical protein